MGRAAGLVLAEGWWCTRLGYRCSLEEVAGDAVSGPATWDAPKDSLAFLCELCFPDLCVD